MRRRILAVFALLTVAAAPDPVQVVDPVYGTWVNPAGTIAVRTAACGDLLCGTIVGATSEAQRDAGEAGVAHLIGTELLRDYRASRPGHWNGTVFVPDMGRTFASHIVTVGPNILRVSGCVLGGYLCKSQDWTRR